MRHYACFRLHMPDVHLPAVVSLSAVKPFPADLRTRLEGLRSILGMACYGAYRTSQAHKIASTYVGPTTGPRVLDGQIVRGSWETIEAGVMFCDVRGFTTLSRQLGTDIIHIMNRLFEVIGDEANQRGGEILKFIGDAMLLIFPLAEKATRMCWMLIDTVQAANQRGQPLRRKRVMIWVLVLEPTLKSFTAMWALKRLDFTVMGPAVTGERLEAAVSNWGPMLCFHPPFNS